MTELQLRQAAQVDIRYWRMLHDYCPNCGHSFANMHPLENLVPHWHGTCNEPQIVVGPNWIRRGNVDCPLADREAQRPVLYPRRYRYLRAFLVFAGVVGLLLLGCWLALQVIAEKVGI